MFKRGETITVDTGSVFLSLVCLGEVQDLDGYLWVIGQDPITKMMHLRPTGNFPRMTRPKLLPALSKDPPG